MLIAGEDEDWDGDDTDNESEYADSLMDAMDDLGWDTETEGSQMTDVSEGGEAGSSGSEDFDTPRDAGESLAKAESAAEQAVVSEEELAAKQGTGAASTQAA